MECACQMISGRCQGLNEWPRRGRQRVVIDRRRNDKLVAGELRSTLSQLTPTQWMNTENYSRAHTHYQNKPNMINYSKRSRIIVDKSRRKSWSATYRTNWSPVFKQSSWNFTLQRGFVRLSPGCSVVLMNFTSICGILLDQMKMHIDMLAPVVIHSSGGSKNTSKGGWNSIRDVQAASSRAKSIFSWAILG